MAWRGYFRARWGRRAMHQRDAVEAVLPGLPHQLPGNARGGRDPVAVLVRGHVPLERIDDYARHEMLSRGGSDKSGQRSYHFRQGRHSGKCAAGGFDSKDPLAATPVRLPAVLFPSSRGARTMSNPRFRQGDRVRVIPGETSSAMLSANYGGWVGTVDFVERSQHECVYRVAWPPEVLAAIDPLYREIWARDGDDADGSQWFIEEQLGPHEGEIPPPPSAEEFVRAFRARDARLAEALGVAGPVEFPFVDEESLAAYHAYLSSRLEFPFEAQFSLPPEPLSPLQPDDGLEVPDEEWSTLDVTAIGLVPWEDFPHYREVGLLCRTLEENRPRDVQLEHLEVKQDGPNRQWVEDFQYWYFTWSDEADSDTDGFADDEDDEEEGFFEFPDDGLEDFDDEDEDEEDAAPGGEFAVEDYLDRGAVVSHEASLPPPRQAPVVREGPRVGRNDDCPCGSGKKHKKCCLRRASS